MEKFLRTKGNVGDLPPMQEPPRGTFAPEPAPRSRELLASYFDLESPGGPLHAQCTADVGLRLAQDLPVPVYQIASLGLLGLFLGPLAIYLGYRAKQEIERGAFEGDAPATVGMILGMAGFVLTASWFIQQLTPALPGYGV